MRASRQQQREYMQVVSNAMLVSMQPACWSWQYASLSPSHPLTLRQHDCEGLGLGLKPPPRQCKPDSDKTSSLHPRYVQPGQAGQDKTSIRAGTDDPGDLGCRLSEEGYSDDEDTSWKVRRAAAKAVSAVIHSFPELLPNIFSQAAPALVGRFREREETVKADIFSTFTDLLRQVGRGCLDHCQ